MQEPVRQRAGTPTRNFIASAAASEATTLTAGPSTPAVSQVAEVPAGGGSENMHRRQAVCPGRISAVIPYVATAPV